MGNRAGLHGVVQRSRLDSRQPENALLSTIARAVD